MQQLTIRRGASSQLVECYIEAVDGGGLTGLAYDSGLTAYYYLAGATATAEITLDEMTLGSWVSGGFVEMDAVHMPGMYQLGIPDAAIVGGGAAHSKIVLQGADDMLPVVIDIEIVGYELEDTFQAKVWLTDDNGEGYDRYVACWFRNSIPYSDTISHAYLTVKNVTDETTLIDNVEMTLLDNGMFYYDEIANRIENGKSYIAIAEATVPDGMFGPVWFQPIGRDS